MIFLDTAPQHRMREPSRAECDAADEAAAQEVAATWGARCFALAEDLGIALDKRAADWNADDAGKLRAIYDDLARALTMARELRA